jgi:protein tyrosine/serine phosphatase
MPPFSPQVPSSTAPPRSSLWRVVLRGVVLGLLLVVVLEAVRVLGGSNFHVVVPGAVYRCAYPSPAFLEQTIRTHGIRTVVNLRGCSDPMPWYLDECRTTARCDVVQEDVSMSAGRLPSVQTIRELVQILDRAEYPILIHCHKGIDRTGLVSAMVLLLHTDTSLAVARTQLSPRFAHMPFGRSGYLDRFFDLYEEWLERQGRDHSRANFRLFAESYYCPGPCRCLMEVVHVPEPTFPRGQPSSITVRCRNTSIKPWYLKPGPGAGVHLRYQLMDSEERVLDRGNAGLFEATVHPEDYVDLTVVLPALGKGRYLLRVDMMDGQHAYFYQTGSEPLMLEVEVP